METFRRKHRIICKLSKRKNYYIGYQKYKSQKKIIDKLDFTKIKNIAFLKGKGKFKGSPRQTKILYVKI